MKYDDIIDVLTIHVGSDFLAFLQLSIFGHSIIALSRLIMPIG